MKYKILINGIFNWQHFITGKKGEIINYCIFCEDESFNRKELCFEGNIFTRCWKGIKFLLDN